MSNVIHSSESALTQAPVVGPHFVKPRDGRQRAADTVAPSATDRER